MGGGDGLRQEQRRLLNELYMESSRVKAPVVKEHITMLLEANVKFLFFAHHREMLDAAEVRRPQQPTPTPPIPVISDRRSAGPQPLTHCPRHPLPVSLSPRLPISPSPRLPVPRAPYVITPHVRPG